MNVKILFPLFFVSFSLHSCPNYAWEIKKKLILIKTCFFLVAGACTDFSTNLSGFSPGFGGTWFTVTSIICNQSNVIVFHEKVLCVNAGWWRKWCARVMKRGFLCPTVSPRLFQSMTKCNGNNSSTLRP